MEADRRVDRLGLAVCGPLQRRLRRARGGELLGDRAPAQLVSDHVAGHRDRRVRARAGGEIRAGAAVERPGDRLPFDREHLSERYRSRRSQRNAGEHRRERCVPVAGERGERVDRGGEHATACKRTGHAGGEDDLSLDTRGVESRPGPARCVAQRRVTRPEVGAGGRDLVRIDRAEKRPAPGPDRRDSRLLGNLLGREPLPLHHPQPRLHRLEPLAATAPRRQGRVEPERDPELGRSDTDGLELRDEAPSAFPHPPRPEHRTELEEPRTAEVQLVDDRSDSRDLPPPVGGGTGGVRVSVHQQHRPGAAVGEPFHQGQDVRAIRRVRRRPRRRQRRPEQLVEGDHRRRACGRGDRLLEQRRRRAVDRGRVGRSGRLADQRRKVKLEVRRRSAAVAEGSRDRDPAGGDHDSRLGEERAHVRSNAAFGVVDPDRRRGRQAAKIRPRVLRRGRRPTGQRQRDGYCS